LRFFFGWLGAAELDIDQTIWRSRAETQGRISSAGRMRGQRYSDLMPAERTLYMDAVLTPNASLSPRAFAIIMALVGIFSFAAGVLYLTVGAWPVFGFFGLDALAIWLAFRVSFRAQAQETRIRVDADHLYLQHIQKGKADKSAKLPTAFVRVELDEPATHLSWLRIEHGSTGYVIGRFLTPDERSSFAKALRRALHQARQERYRSPA